MRQRPSGAGQARGGSGDTGGKTSFSPGLYVVATPIGNARDITLRALDLLAAADVIACEDTRVTRKLLTLHDIATPTLAYHEHNAERARPALIERLKEGQI
ncbi:MAG TPA: SAM-dependent methyltransferase, partial [Alphaproteobacteria bacterium]|nr:SAM-dependent methyltransferase [Alphaproteobacteria bacterium]